MRNVSQGASDVSTYYTKVKSLWDELDDLDEVPDCACASAEKIFKREQNKKLLQFLMGLNDDYNSIRGNILMMSPLPSISQVYSMLIQEEKQREIRSSGHFFIDSAFLAVETVKQQQPYKGKTDKSKVRFDSSYGRFEKVEGRKSSMFCNYCKKPGHAIEKCYRLHGFPPSTEYKGGRRFAAMAQPNDQEGECHGSQLSQTNVLGLNVEQSSQLIALLQNIQLAKPSYTIGGSSKSSLHYQLNSIHIICRY